MHEKLQTRKAKIYKKIRSATVEPVLGTLINFGGMKRIWTKGIQQANKFMLGAAIAYNLKKWLNYAAPIKKIAIQAIEKIEITQKQLQNWFYFVFTPYHKLWNNTFT
jgi:hypothetical protein